MTIEQLRNFYNSIPFQPFEIRTADGNIYEIPHRDFISVFPNQRTFMVHKEDETYAVIDLLLVCSIELKYPAKPMTSSLRS